MRSRYDITKSSSTQNENGEYYPDVLTFDITKFVYNYSYFKVQITKRYKDRFYLSCFEQYGSSQYDDIVLWLNDVESVHDLEIGEYLFFPDKRDIDSFLIDNKVSNNE